MKMLEEFIIRWNTLLALLVLLTYLEIERSSDVISAIANIWIFTLLRTNCEITLHIASQLCVLVEDVIIEQHRCEHIFVQY